MGPRVRVVGQDEFLSQLFHGLMYPMAEKIVNPAPKIEIVEPPQIEIVDAEFSE